MNLVSLLLVLVGAAVVAGVFFVRYVITRTNSVEVEFERLKMLNADLEIPSDQTRQIRLEQAKMINGGYPASEVDFSPSNCNV